MNEFTSQRAANDDNYLMEEGFAFAPGGRTERKALTSDVSEEQVVSWMANLPIRHFKRLLLNLQALRDPSVMVKVLEEMNWADFERAVAEAYQGQGWSAQLTKTGEDGGVDVFLRHNETTWLVQCKHWKSKVGAREVRELYGLMHHHRADRVVMVCLNGFSYRAVEFAMHKAIDLVDGVQLADMLSVSMDLVETSPTPESNTECSGAHIGLGGLDRWIKQAGVRINRQRWTTKDAFYDNYIGWCKQERVMPLASSKFWSRMRVEFIEVGQELEGTQITIGSVRKRCVPLTFHGAPAASVVPVRFPVRAQRSITADPS